jgi:serine/threonine protein phosphatase 1
MQLHARHMRPTVVIGDIHGDAYRLGRALDAVLAEGRRVVLVGDYVNRGGGSRQVLTHLAQARRQLGSDLVLLRGNHDAALLDFLETGESARLIRHGGLVTVKSYMPAPGPEPLADLRKSFPDEHYELLRSTLPYLEEPGLLISHAGYDPLHPQERDERTLVFGRHSRLFTNPGKPPQQVVVFGHYVQTNGRPYHDDHLFCIDTGCGTIDSGPLTMLRLPELTFEQF